MNAEKEELQRALEQERLKISSYKQNSNLEKLETMKSFKENSEKLSKKYKISEVKSKVIKL